MKKNLLLLALLGTGLMLSGIGCGTTDSASSDTGKAEAKADETKTAIPIPADSPFAKIKLDMSMDEVFALIGRPDDTSNHITGKAFMPYYYGGDTHRTEAIYKGQGRIIFCPRNHWTQSLGVMEIVYNPSEK